MLSDKLLVNEVKQTIINELNNYNKEFGINELNIY